MTACGSAELYLFLIAIYPWTSHGTLEFYGKQIPFSVCLFYLSLASILRALLDTRARNCNMKRSIVSVDVEIHF